MPVWPQSPSSQTRVTGVGEPGRSRAGGPQLGYLAIVALAFTALVLRAGISAPFEKDQETQSAQWIQGITQRGQWLIPVDDYGGIDRKPPLYYWLSALVVKATGGRVCEQNARAVSWVSAVVLAGMTMGYAGWYMGASTGWLSLAFILGTYGFASRATVDLTDMLLSALLFGVWWCVYGLVEIGESRTLPLAGGILLGLAILTKGPVAILLIGLAGLIYLLLVGKSPLQVLRRGWPWRMLLVGVAIGACWYVPAFIEGGARVIRVFVSENFGHFMPAALGGTGEASRPIWYIALRMFGGSLPMSLLIVALAVAMWRRDEAKDAHKPLLFQASLVLAVLIFFSVASSKRDDYILPALPGLMILFAALFSGAAIDATREGFLSARLRNVTAGGIAAAVLAMVVGALILARTADPAAPLSFLRLQSSDRDFLRLFLGGLRALSPPFAVFVACSMLGGAILFAGLFIRRPLWSGAGLALIAISASTLFTATLRPALARERSMKTFAREVHARIGDAPLYVPWGRDYELSFYYGRGIWGLDHDRQAVATARHPVYIVARPRGLPRIPVKLRGRMRLMMRSHLIGGGGAPALYELVPFSAPPGLNSSSG